MITVQTNTLTERRINGRELESPSLFMGEQHDATGGCFYRYDSKNQIYCIEDIFEKSILFEDLKEYLPKENKSKK